MTDLELSFPKEHTVAAKTKHSQHKMRRKHSFIIQCVYVKKFVPGMSSEPKQILYMQFQVQNPQEVSQYHWITEHQQNCQLENDHNIQNQYRQEQMNKSIKLIKDANRLNKISMINQIYRKNESVSKTLKQRSPAVSNFVNH